MQALFRSHQTQDGDPVEYGLTEEIVVNGMEFEGEVHNLTVQMNWVGTELPEHPCTINIELQGNEFVVYVYPLNSEEPNAKHIFGPDGSHRLGDL